MMVKGTTPLVCTQCMIRTKVCCWFDDQLVLDVLEDVVIGIVWKAETCISDDVEKLVEMVISLTTRN